MSLLGRWCGQGWVRTHCSASLLFFPCSLQRAEAGVSCPSFSGVILWEFFGTKQVGLVLFPCLVVQSYMEANSLQSKFTRVDYFKVFPRPGCHWAPLESGSQASPWSTLRRSGQQTVLHWGGTVDFQFSKVHVSSRPRVYMQLCKCT